MTSPSDNAALKTPEHSSRGKRDEKAQAFDVRKSMKKALRAFPKSFKKLAE